MVMSLLTTLQRCEDQVRLVCKTMLCTVKNSLQGFPGGAVVENLPANAGDTGSSPGLGGSHMLRSGWARGPQLLSLRVWSLCSATREATAMRSPRTARKSSPHSTRESPRAAKKTQCSQK